MFQSNSLTALSIGFCLIAFMGCEKEPATNAAICATGATQLCDCLNDGEAVQGVQECILGGAAWGPCACDTGDDDTNDAVGGAGDTASGDDATNPGNDAGGGADDTASGDDATNPGNDAVGPLDASSDSSVPEEDVEAQNEDASTPEEDTTGPPPSEDDKDGDGYDSTEDCDDEDNSIHPLAGDTYGDGVDSDCDGLDCEAGYVGEVYYAVCRETKSGESVTSDWAGSDAVCKAHGYESLAKVVDASENTGMMSLVTQAGSWPDIWIGLSDPEDDGVWTWMDGAVAEYFNWCCNEPSPGEANCVEIYGENDWTWNDRSCSEVFPFVCENRSVAPSTPPDKPDDESEAAGCASMSFAGNSGYVEVENSPELEAALTDMSNGVTMEAWINLNSTDCGIIARKHVGGNMGFEFSIQPGGQIRFFSEGNPTGAADSGSLVPVGEWTHVAATLDGAKVRIWNNGTMVYEETHILPEPTTDSLLIGAFPPGNKCYLDGALYQLRISSGVLYTESFVPEVVPTQSDATLAHWPLNDIVTDDFDENTARDLSGNGNHGSLLNSPEWVAGDCPGGE